MSKAPAQERLVRLINHWGLRGIGHTYRTIHGADKKTILIGHSMMAAQDMARMVEGGVHATVSIDNLTPLLGSRAPIVVDHTALTFLLSEYMAEHDAERLGMLEKIGDQDQEINRLKDIAGRLERSAKLKEVGKPAKAPTKKQVETSKALLQSKEKAPMGKKVRITFGYFNTIYDKKKAWYTVEGIMSDDPKNLCMWLDTPKAKIPVPYSSVFSEFNLEILKPKEKK